MARIVHLAMRVEDIDKASEFYTNVFGFKRVTVPGLRSTVRYLTDGTVHIAINQIRSGKNEQPAIDHFGVEVEREDHKGAVVTCEFPGNGLGTIQKRKWRVLTEGGVLKPKFY